MASEAAWRRSRQASRPTNAIDSNNGGVTAIYDTLGASVFVARRFFDSLMPYAGFDFAIPRGLDTRYVDGDYGTRDLIGGVRWLFDGREFFSFVYAGSSSTIPP